MKQPKFNFVPERLLGKKLRDDNTAMYVSIYSNSQMVIPGEAARIYELDGKYANLYADVENKVIGWSLIEGKTNLPEINDARLLKIDINGSIKIGIGKLLSRCGYEKGFSVKKLPVLTYKSSLYPDEIYYIKLPEKVVESDNDDNFAG